MAATELIEAGHEVIVLEARSRPGGRVRTLRAPFAADLYAEGSAARIPESHELTLDYVRLLDLPLEPFQPQAPDLLYLDGQVLRSDQPDLLALAGMTAEEQQLGPGGIADRFLAPLLAELGDLSAAEWPREALLRYDRMSATELMQSLGMSNAAIRFFDAGFGLFDEVAAMSEQDRARFAVHAISEVFPEVGDYYDGAHSVVWDEDPWTGGAYTAYGPGEMNRFYRHLARPEGRIHFAGEHASPWPGWMLGALHSGVRAAQEVNAVRS